MWVSHAHWEKFPQLNVQLSSEGQTEVDRSVLKLNSDLAAGNQLVNEQ